MSAELIHQMYIAYYQRPADPGGHQFWLNRLNAEGGGATGWAAISADFISGAESDALYGTASTEAKLAQFYTAAFGRASTSTEVTALLGDGTANLGVLAYNLVTGASGDDLLTVNQKVDYAEAFVAQLDPVGLGIGPFQFFYEDPSLGRDLNVGVSKTTDVSSAAVLSQIQGAIPTSDPAAASPTLPTAERTTELTSGPDVVALTGETTDQINAALGGTSPTLARTDQIDGGSAQDIMKVAMDGNFLLGFSSSGFVKNVEIFDLAATAPSVTPKTFNFTGVTGVDQINVGAGNAPIIVSNISDTDLTLNLSGQSTGSFDVGFATGTISGSGSSLTVGVSDLGSNGNNISITADLITDLDVVSYGRGNYIDLGGGVNDLQTVSVSGKADVYIDGLPTSVSGFTATGAGGDVTVGIDATTTGNTHLSDATATLTGGAGFDTIRLDTGGTFAASTTSFEEVFFDGAISTSLTVRATGMQGLNTLSFSGVTSSTPIVKGLGDQALTVNAITESSPSGASFDVTGTGALTVNLNGNPTQVALASSSANNFKFESSTEESVSINVGAYVSSSGTYVLDSRGDVNVVVDGTSNFASTLRASGAETITVTGNGDIAATISGREASTITVNAGSGTLAIGSSAAKTFNLSTQSGITIGSASKMSGVQTMTVDIGQNTADLANLLGFQDMRVLNLSGAGTASSVQMGEISGSGNAMTLTLSGLGGGFSADTVDNRSGNITIEASTTTGSIDIGQINNLAGGNINIVTGTLGNFSSNTVESIGTFTLDASAHTGGSGSISFNEFSANGAVNISMGSGSGDLTLTNIEAAGNYTIDANSYGGQIDVAALSAGGNMTVQLGSEGDFSATEILTGGTFILDGTNATTAQMTFDMLTAGGGVTISMGTGSGEAVVSAGTGGAFTLDAANFDGLLSVGQVSASGNIVVSMGSLGHFSATDVATKEGSFTLDGSNSTSGRVSLANVTAGQNVTISMGTGTGSGSIAAVTAGKNFVLDASRFEGALELGLISASGSNTISVGPKGDLSATDVKAGGNFTLDAGASTSGAILLSSVSAGGNMSIAMGTGTGGVTLTDADTAGKFTLDASKFLGTVLVKDLNASGTVAVSIGAEGNFSADGMHTTGSLTIDGSAAQTGEITLRTISASGVTISMGTGTGAFASQVNIDSDKGFIFDGSNFAGTVDYLSLTASGTTTLSIGNGDFSADATNVNGNYTLDKSTASTGNVVFSSFSAGGNTTISMGAGSGSLAVSALQGNGTVTISGAQYTGSVALTGISAGAIAVNLAGGETGGFSAGTIYSTSSFTLTQTAGASGAIAISAISASGAISFALGSGNGSGNFTNSVIETDSTFSITGSQNGDITLDTVSALSGFTVNMAGSGSFTASSMQAGAAFTFSRPVGSSESVVITDLSGDTVSITMGAASSHFSASTITAGSFTFDSTLSTESTAQHGFGILSASGAINISLGADDGVLATAITTSADFTLTKGTGSSEVIVNVGLTAANVTINGAGVGQMSFSSIGVSGGFTFNGTGMGSVNADGDLSYFSATFIEAASGDVTFNFGTGSNGFVDVSSIQTISAFNFAGAGLSTADITISLLSATQAVTFSNMGNAVGTAAIAAIDTDETFTFNAGASGNLFVDIGTLSASGASVVLGNSDEVQFSSIVTDTLTIDGTNFGGDLTFSGAITTSGMSITMGGNASALTMTSTTTETFSLVSTSGGSLSAEIANVAVSAFTIVGTEDAGSLTISAFNYSASGSITGTGGADNVAVSAMSLNTTDVQTFTFDMREDSSADVFKFAHGGARQIVKILNFTSGSDSVSAEIIATNYGNHATAVGTTTAAQILQDALGSNVAGSDLTAVSNVTAAFTLGSDIFVLAGSAHNTAGTFDAGQVIFQFVNTDTLVAGDMGTIS